MDKKIKIAIALTVIGIVVAIVFWWLLSRKKAENGQPIYCEGENYIRLELIGAMVNVVWWHQIYNQTYGANWEPSLVRHWLKTFKTLGFMNQTQYDCGIQQAIALGL